MARSSCRWVLAASVPLVLSTACGGGDGAARDSIPSILKDSAITVPAVPLSIADAMLPDDAFPAPWQPQHRDSMFAGFDYGPFQSSCPAYEVAERFQGRSGGQVLWWVDGGNANHYVSREEYPGEGAEVVEMVATAPERCGRVQWGEGGAVVLEPLDLGNGVAGFSMSTEGSNDRGLVAASSHGDLISVLWVPLWHGVAAEYPDLSVEDFAKVASRARDLLLAAGPAEPSVPDAVSTTPPTTPTTTTASRTSTAATAPELDSTVDPALAAMLLEQGEVGEEWVLDSVERFVDESQMGDRDADDCPAERALASLEDLLEVQSWWWGSTDLVGAGTSVASMSQVLGVAPSVEAAREIVDELGVHDGCDFTALVGDPEFHDEFEISGGAVAIKGVDAPVSELVLVEPDGGEMTMLTVASGDVVTMILVYFDSGPPATEPGRDLVAAAYRKLAAAG